MNEQLREYLIFYNGKQFFKDRCIRDISLMHDLGMYGDEIQLDLYAFIENDLGIRIGELEEVLGYRIMSYFRPEFSSWWSIFKLSQTDNIENYPRFTVGMLEDAIDKVLKNRLNTQ